MIPLRPLSTIAAMGPESSPQEPAEVTHVNTEDTGVATGQKRARPDHVEDEKESQKRLRRNEGEVSKTAGRNKFNKSRSERRNQGQWDARNKEGGDQDKVGGAARVEGEDGDRGEARRPKKKVAVLIGYAGTGYKGMQMTKDEKTIEADLFAGFCAAGAISKVNADDPKKSSFVRCARTDKGVHAAGNVVSLKLIVEDKDIVQKINAELPDQIRVWSIVPTVGSFSCYTQCDSRIYEYLIPSYCLLPPDPKSSLAETLVEAATSENDLESYLERRSGNEDFWSTLESEQLQPYLQTLEPAVRESLLAGRGSELSAEALLNFKDEQHYAHHGGATEPEEVEPGPQSTLVMKIKAAHSHLRSLTLSSKRHCRIAFSRLTRLRDVLAAYVGSRRFHNYTIRVSSNDPSAVRTIKSFTASEPFLIGETEWISLKVHGQSFMMHQIRKMVAMAVLMVRCGTPIDLIRDTTMKNSLAIPVPKAPALGLLLERPVFDTYSKKAVEMHERKLLILTSTKTRSRSSSSGRFTTGSMRRRRRAGSSMGSLGTSTVSRRRTLIT